MHLLIQQRRLRVGDFDKQNHDYTLGGQIQIPKFLTFCPSPIIENHEFFLRIVESL